MTDAPAVIFHQAADVFRTYGYEFPDPRVEAGSALVMGGAAAVAYKGMVILNPEVERDLGSLASVIAKPTVLERVAAFRRCGARCAIAAKVTLHETAHVVQYEHRAKLNYWRSEGVAEAVALDLYPVFIRRLLGATPTRCFRPDVIPQYWTYVEGVRAASANATGGRWITPAARSWRFRALAQ